jgi:hypothetical protein
MRRDVNNASGKRFPGLRMKRKETPQNLSNGKKSEKALQNRNLWGKSVSGRFTLGKSKS